MNFFDNFTPEQLKEGFRKSAEGLKFLIDKAEKKGVNKINGMTLEYLNERYEFYVSKSK